MVTTVITTKEGVTGKPKTAPGGTRGGGGVPQPPPRNGRGGAGGPGGGPSEDFSPERYRIGMWVALAAILMMFTALTSAYIVRAGMSDDWRPISAPPLLWVSTGLILLSSVTLEMARRALAHEQEERAERARALLFLTLVAGLGFLATQLLAWRQLAAQGIYLASNPHSSFFYVLTAAHGVHLLGGILALNYLLLRSRKGRDDARAAVRRRTAVEVVALYWHFMDGLWIYLFALLFLWR